MRERFECGYAVYRWQAGRALFQPAHAGALSVIVEQCCTVTTTSLSRLAGYAHHAEIRNMSQLLTLLGLN